MINEKLNKKEVYNYPLKIIYNNDSAIKMYTAYNDIVILSNDDNFNTSCFGIKNKHGNIVIYCSSNIKNYTQVAENLFNLYAISANFKLKSSL